jgi:hypothetical protein
MSYTWKDIKLATLQKMYAADGAEIVEDESTKDYIAGMPYAANEGLLRLTTAGKFIVKSISINHMPVKNEIPEMTAIALNDGTNFEYAADGIKSYYFQYSGIGRCFITGGDEEREISIDSYGSFTEIKGNYPNTTGAKVTIRFESDYPATVKNIALYKATFPETDDVAQVPEYGRYVKYDLKTLASDFYNLFENSITYEGGVSPVYLSTTDYYRESDHILILPSNKPGMYTIYYHAYPVHFTEETEDDYVLPLDDEVAALLPLYMASQLYMDDDLAISTSLRNFFEVGLDSLVNTSHYSGKESFTSEWV